MIDSLLRILIGVVVSIVAAAILMPLTFLIAKLLRRIIGGKTAQSVCQRVGKPSLNTDLADKVETAIIGGLIGGVVFASLSPALAPAMYDFHVDSGIVDQPEPDLSVHELRGVSEETISEEFEVRADENYSVYVLELHNDDNRALSDYNLNVRFPGCVERTSMGATTFGAAVVSNETEQVQVGEFSNRSANATCYGAIQIDEFSTQSSTVVTFLVNDTADESRTEMYPAPENESSVYLSNSYTWKYNSRSYYEPAELTSYNTTIANNSAA
ncbi:hypothetical protein [Halorientalis salina]|uniref:hypothetical protein n=1 Tax=Halorientalis salina TaxID=2932266 RepID=UPI0010ABA6FA|nr:hypothetical protein [Halorientalis salina]